MIPSVIRWSASHPWWVVVAAALLALLGIRTARELPLDALPDLSDPQVVVLTEWSGRSPDLVEDHVTYPLSAMLRSAPDVEAVRGQSLFGLSFVTVVFADGTDLYEGRSRVLEQLAQVQRELPADASPTLGPDATGVGWVYQYALVDRSGTRDLQQLRDLQDVDLRYALQAVPGVAEVASVGGFRKQFQVHLSPEALLAHEVTVPQVAAALRGSNVDAGGQTVEVAGHEQVVRGVGRLRDRADIETVPVAVSADGRPVTLGELGWVGVGPAPRRGFADLDGEGEVVGGIVVMRTGHNALRVIDAVKERLSQVSHGLPAGVEVVTVYDRAPLIEDSVATLERALLEEMAVVGVVLLLFLLHLRSALVPLLGLPVAVAVAFVPMGWQGLGADVMSLGGIALAIGAMVDAAVVLLDNVHKALEKVPDDAAPAARHQAVVQAMVEVGPRLFLSLVLITVSFLPVFTLQAAEGRLYRPLAFTKTWSMAAAAVLAVTLTPALVVLLVRGKVRAEAEHPLGRWLIAAYAPVVRRCVRWRWAVVGAAAVVVALAAPVAWRLPSAFVPSLNEGSLLFMPTAPPGMGATEAGVALQVIDRALAEVPEVERVFGKMGRAETATDPAPMGMAEVWVQLAPRDRWRPGLTWDDLVAELDGRVQVPGMPNLWWMPIETRTEMLASGLRSPVGVQVFGADAAVIEAASLRIEEVVAALPGTRSALAERGTEGLYVDVTVDRPAAARFGLRSDAIMDTVATAIGGLPVTEVLDGRQRYGVSVRFAQDRRDDVAALRQVLVPTPTGAQVPLGQVASVDFVAGPPMIRSEDGQRVGYVFVDPGDAPLGAYVAQLEAALDELSLPGVRLATTGQFEHLQRAQARLVQVVPLTVVLVVLLLWASTGSGVETALVLLAVPFSLVGAVALLWWTATPVTVAVWVGLIALAGLDAEMAVVMLLYLDLAWADRREGDSLEDVIVAGSAHRVRPKLMTVATTTLALLPLLWSTGVGAEVMRPLAVPMVGGLASSFVMELLVLPALWALWRGRERIERAG